MALPRDGWVRYDRCDTCGAKPGDPCTSLKSGKPLKHDNHRRYILKVRRFKPSRSPYSQLLAAVMAEEGHTCADVARLFPGYRSPHNMWHRITEYLRPLSTDVARELLDVMGYDFDPDTLTATPRPDSDTLGTEPITIKAEPISDMTTEGAMEPQYTLQADYPCDRHCQVEVDLSVFADAKATVRQARVKVDDEHARIHPDWKAKTK